MGRYLVRRLLLLVPVMLGAATIAFALVLLLPGDPAIALLGQDRPIPIQLGLYFLRIARGDFGTSVTLHTPVLGLISSTLPATLELAVASLVLAVGCGIPLGVFAARRRGRFPDTLAMLVAQLGVSVPVFWLGVLLILLFAVKLNWLPSFGRGAPLIGGIVTGNLTGLADSLS